MRYYLDVYTLKPANSLKKALVEEARDKRYGGEYIRFIMDHYPDAIYRLEVEKENEPAYHLFRKLGFETMPYLEMIIR